MGDHQVLRVGYAKVPGATESMQNVEPSRSFREDANMPIFAAKFFADKSNVNIASSEEEEALIQTPECRICQEEDEIENFETPCNCSGSLKYAHRACVQRWCDEKGDTTCEICHVRYEPGYTAPHRVHAEETVIEISEGWAITGAPLDLHDPRLIAVAAAQSHYLDSEYEDYEDTNARGAAFCRSAAMILMALLLLRHAFNFTGDDGDEDASTVLSLFLLRTAGFLLPCYIVAWAVSIVQRRRQRQEAAAMAATEVAFILQSAEGRAFQFTIAPDSPITPQQEPNQ
ncbi:uncharacterized protein A4U43_C07F35300 [Asparagus officinalis]|uniref:RING-CH-type domain-containing protein n=1 Tax=Asparagus officinalis TaxID=4686 RepID=A0A5P1EKD5_ASPOF|nr:uncharacterized protein LOC109848944 [Asparagus officinalis]XP_020274272.1 uncharacterized protein LOC109848944 [Asparagus officinalis]XP_020274273.1 uncharacterized protein LOC109848944 [Asparagus officinalis]ONK65259.1 uncharacterized protein A4U43_C07F35300 [Asparagus officinalis]